GAIATIAIRNVIEERDLADAARTEAVASSAIANDRAETMLLDRASTLTTSDPTRAVALIRQLPGTSKHLRRARDIAEAAASRGIVRGHASTIGAVRMLFFTPNGRSLIAAGETGDVVVIDVETGAARIYRTRAKSTTLGLALDDDRIVLAGRPEGLMLLDLRTGVTTTIDPTLRVSRLSRVDGDRIRYVDEARKVLAERSLATGAVTTLRENVLTAQPIGDRFMVADGESLRLVGSGRDILLTGAEWFGITANAAVDVKHGRFAVVGRAHVVEWSFEGVETRRWNVELGVAMSYGPNGALYVGTARGLVMRLDDDLREVARGTDGVWWTVQTSDGVAYLGQEGALTIVDPANVRTLELNYPSARQLAASSRFLAFGSRDGTIRWLDLDLMRPASYPVQGEIGCWATATKVYVGAASGIREIDRRTRATRMAVTRSKALPPSCVGMVGTTIISSNFMSTSFLDVSNDTQRVLDLQGLYDRVAKLYLVIRGLQLVDIDPTTGGERSLWTAPSKIKRYASHGRWVATTLETGTIFRIDRETGAAAAVDAKADVVALLADGRIVYDRANELYEWSPTETRFVVSRPPGEIDLVAPVRDGYAMRYADGSLWFVHAGQVLNRAPPGHMLFIGFGFDDSAYRLVQFQRLVRTHIATGEQTVLDVRLQFVALVNPGLTLGTTPGHVVVLEDHVPDDPERLFAWIDATTNAHLDSTNALVWHGAVTR
ncbi:MAG: hypothetical protein H0V17_05670, partial [Deltaproteobacteria bacterium]|nr:hypothetical protein [Deltaproteobacteria bacterium]